MIEFERIAGQIRVSRQDATSGSRGNAVSADGQRGGGTTAAVAGRPVPGASEFADSGTRIVPLEAALRSAPVERLRSGAGTAEAVNPLTGEPREDAQTILNELLEDFLGNGFGERELRISIDEESDRFVYETVDIESGEVVHQFPPEDLLRVVASIREIAGLILDQDA